MNTKNHYINRPSLPTETWATSQVSFGMMCFQHTKAEAIVDDSPTHWFCFPHWVSAPALDQFWEEKGRKKSRGEREKWEKMKAG